MNKFLVLALGIGLISLQGTALAVEISATVESVDTASNKLSVSYTNPETEAPEQADILVKPETSFAGVTGFFDIKVGDMIVVEAAEEAATGVWIANSLKVTGEKGNITEDLPADQNDITEPDPGTAPEGPAEDLSTGPSSR